METQAKEKQKPLVSYSLTRDMYMSYVINTSVDTEHFDTLCVFPLFAICVPPPGPAPFLARNFPHFFFSPSLRLRPSVTDQTAIFGLPFDHFPNDQEMHVGTASFEAQMPTHATLRAREERQSSLF